MFVLDRSQRARVQKFPRVVAAVVSLALLATALETHQPAEAAPSEDPKPAAQKVESRPDLISAAVTARSQGSRVEVESMRTETSTTWSNPDGTMTTDAHAAPIRFKTNKGSWQPVDLTLQKNLDGTVAPRGHKLGVRLGKRNDATGQVFASATSGTGRQVEMIAPWKLPEPTIDGTKATYADVQPGVDLTMDARRSGFETDFIVKQRPATSPVWRIPLRTKGLTAKQQKDGTIAFVDAKNVVHSTIPLSYMWDSAKDKITGEPVNKTTVKVTVEQVSPGKATLVVTPDAKWFLDPAREFPVTVDPTYANTPVMSTFDTFVQSGYTSDLSSLVDLRVGKNGVTTERSFLNFPTAPFIGKDVVAAHLSLMQYGSTTCTPTVVNLHAANPATTATRWTDQPTTSSQVWGSVSAAKGFSSSCAADRIYIPMTGLAQFWSGVTYPTAGIALKAANEADAASWKRFYSTEGPADPYISLTWNRPPNAPATVQPTEAVAYAAPGETESSLYSAGRRPWVTTKATDPDANTVKYIYEFYTGSGDTFSLKGTCTSSVYASGTTAGCRPSNELPDNTLLYIRAKANDGRVDGPWTSYNTRLRIGNAVPAQPIVSCPPPFDVNNTWADNEPAADVVCTVTATGTGYNAPGYLRLIIDGQRPAPNFTGGASGQIKITPSSDPAVAKYEVKFPKNKPGLHTIVVQAESPAGKLSSTATHRLGWGGTALTSPAASPRTTTTSTIRIAAAGPPKGTAPSVTAKVRWRVAGYGGSEDTVGWNEDATELPVVDNGAAGVTVNTNWDTTLAKIDNFLDSDPNTAGVQPTTLNDRVPVKLDVQVCFTYGITPQCTWSQTPDTTVQRVPHAFGDGFPTDEAGPGEVALWTGEFNLDASDVSVPALTGNLSISRSHLTYTGPGNGITGVFGEGWIANFDGADAGAGGMEVVDSTRVDGTIALRDGDGTGLIFESPTGQRRTTAVFAPGTWGPADEDTEQAGSQLTVSGTATAPILSLIEDDGTVTTWSAGAAPTATGPTAFRPAGIAEPGSASKTTYSYDGAGRITRILAPAPAGVTCPATGTLNAGCSALRFVYVTIGSSRVRMGEAWLDVYNPDKTGGAAMDSIKVAAYSYDTLARLTKVTDPRSGLSTEYTYNSLNHLTSMKPAGQVPFQFNYVTVDQREKLDTVQRVRPAGDPTGGSAVLDRFVYDVPLSGPGLPDLSAATVSQWGQVVAPTKGFAVFGADRVVSSPPTADDWQYATISYTDNSGNTVNTAEYGAGAWQFTASDYDAEGNVVRELDERAIRLILDGQFPAGAADQLATLTVYNPDIKNPADDTVLTPAGTLVTDTYSPSRSVVQPDGATQWVRTHTRSAYDEGAPNQGINPETKAPYRLVTRETTWSNDSGSGADLDLLSQTLTDYGPPVSGDPDGWGSGLAGKSVVDVNGNGVIDPATDIVRLTRYNSAGQVIESRQPTSNGADAGTTRTAYYTAGATTPAVCGGKPYWAGAVCQVAPAASPTSGPSLPTTTTTSYSYLLAPTAVVETSGAVTRSRLTTYLSDGREKTGKLLVSGLTGSTPTTQKDTSYDAATGLSTVITATSANGTTLAITTGYDSWGRKTSYQPAGQAATTTSYNAAGSVARISDPYASTSYEYDGTDALGKAEHRGLVTKADFAYSGATWTSTGAYDAAAELTVQKLPGGITRTQERDNAGEPVGLGYKGPVTRTGEGGTPVTDPDGAWISWSIDNDAVGRVARMWTPDGAALGGTAGDGTPADRSYTYDRADRLIQVRDRTAPAWSGPGADPDTVPCQTRSYEYDANGNRLTKSKADTVSGPCASQGGSSESRPYDSADRPASYTYDELGRTTGITAADAPKQGAGAISMSYYDDDGIRTMTQGGTTTTYELDTVDRRQRETVATTGLPSVETTSFYTDESDNPAWTVMDGAVQRYAELIGSDLTLTVDDQGADLAISDPHGDVVTTVTLNPTASATGISGWNSFDEFGNARTANSAGTGQLNYGWLGASQRAASPTGLLLMGARVYSPTSGTFTSVDPVRGGNATPYTYPGDPVNRFDTTGKRELVERGSRKATSKKQVKRAKQRLKRYLRKAKSRARSALRTYKRARANGRSGGGWACFWAIFELMLAYTTFVATVYYPIIGWIFVVLAIGWIVKAIAEVAMNCGKSSTGGRD